MRVEKQAYTLPSNTPIIPNFFGLQVEFQIVDSKKIETLLMVVSGEKAEITNICDFA